MFVKIPDKVTIQNVCSLAVIENLASGVGTRAYIWGGFIIDIYSNRIVRNHDDIECLVVNLYDYLSKLEKLFAQEGWETEILENGDLKVEKDRAKVQLGHLEIERAAKWYHNGKKGVIIFPKEWLNPNLIQFLNLKIHAVYPEFQYVLKKNPGLMNPDWKVRDKDRKDIKRLEEILVKNGVDFGQLSKQVQSIVLEG